MHSPDNQWQAAWRCYSCGLQERATAEHAVDVRAWLLASQRLSPDRWQAAAAASSSAEFWAVARDVASELVKASDVGGDYLDAVPPQQLVSERNSRSFVPLLLDAAGLLSARAQQAWRAHHLTSTDWHAWVHELGTAAPVSMAAVITRLQTKMQAAARACELTTDVCLVWHSARRFGDDTSRVTLRELVGASRMRRGYIPGPVQEVLLETFGESRVSQGAALLAVSWRDQLRPQRAPVNPVSSFVQGPNLVTGAGWASGGVGAPPVPASALPGVAAAREACDTQPPPQQSAPPSHFSIADESDGAVARAGPRESICEPAGGAPHSSTADADDDHGSTGLTQNAADMAVDGAAEPAPAADNAQGGRRVRRRRSAPNQGQLLCCSMCQSADAFQAHDSRGLMQHIVRTHLGQPLLPETVAQLRALGRVVCRVCASIRAATTPHCGTCGCATPTRPLQLGDVVPDRRRGGSQGGSSATQPGGHVPPASAGSGSPDTQNSYLSVAVVPREVTVSEDARSMAQGLRQHTLEELPMSVAARAGTCMAESLEGCMAGNATWGFLARYRSRTLLAHVPKGTDRVAELKRRLRLWEQGRFDELILSVAGQQQLETSARTSAELHGEEQRGAKARQQAAAGAKSKAVKGLVGGLATASPEQRATWTAEMIPRSDRTEGPCATPAEHEAARACAWGGGDFAQARKEMQTAGRRPDSPPGIPWAKLAPWSAAGPTGDRQEHLEAMQRASSPAQRRRLNRVLDELAVRWATNLLPASCRWLLNTLAVFLRKSRAPTSKVFDDEEWLRVVQTHEWAQDIPESDIESVGSELGADDDASMADAAAATGAVQVRPIQIGEFLRRLTSKRLLVLHKADSGRLMQAMRQIGVGTLGGAEALAILHQLLHDIWAEEELPGPVARIKIDERNCFGSLEWQAIRAATYEALPRHYAATCWKHAERSSVEQRGVAPAPKDRGAEQGDVDGSMECSVTLGGVAAAARCSVHAMQRRGELPWARPGSSGEAAAECDRRQERITAWRQLGPTQRREPGEQERIMVNPAHEIQTRGGIVDAWYLDDGDILCDPRLVRAYLSCFDAANPQVGGTRNIIKTEVVYYATDAQMAEHSEEWHLAHVRAMATVRMATDPGMTLGVAVGPRGKVEEQLRQKVQVVRAMQERVAICQDAQTEHVLNRESLGVGRVNHILRVHGDALVEAGDALAAFDASTKAEMSRLFPGLTDEGHEQASLAVRAGGLGWRRASDIARAANLSALVMARPFVRHMAAEATRAGLLREGSVEARLDRKIQAVADGYLRTLDEADRAQATNFIEKAREAAERNWQQVAVGAREAVAAPALDVTFDDGDADQASGSPTRSNEDENEDDGSRAASRRPLTAQHLQRELAKLGDRTRLRSLEATLRRQCDWGQLEELRDLRHKHTSHKWIHHLDARRGSVLSQADYIINVQRRLGARIQERAQECRLCGALLDPQLVHGDCCDTAGATRGHYAVVRELVRGLKLADPSTTTEPTGLITTQSRPADILTNAAAPGRSAALDVCVASPHASNAAGDAAESAFRRKLRRYRREIPELVAAGIIYRPMVWTTAGRPHPAATRTLHFAAEQAASRSDGATAGALAARWRHEIQIALLRRRAAMARAVLPRLTAREAWMLTGWSTAVPSSERRLPPLREAAEDITEDEGLESVVIEVIEEDGAGSDASGD